MQRLLKRSEFQAAARGRRFHTERMSVQGLHLAADGGRGLRLGLTLTRKVGHATERNRIRRRLRVAAAAAAAPFAERPVDVVVIGRRDAISASFQTLVDDLSRALAAVTQPRAAGASPAPASRAAARSPSQRGDHA